MTNSSVGFELDIASARAARDSVRDDGLRAAKESVSGTTRWLEQSVEELIRAAVKGNLWRAIASRTFPPGSRLANDPVGTVYIKGGARSKGAITFYTAPGRIVGRRGQYLAIPTAAAGSRGRDRALSPSEWEARTGVKLRFVARPGRAPLLVADEGTTGRGGAFRPITRRRTKADERRGFVRGSQTVVIFVLIPFVPFANSVAIDPLVAQAPDRLERDFDSRLGALR
jgi:hypothetical protein